MSPLLSNVYLDRLDKFVEQTLLPAYNRGERRAPNRRYYVLKSRAGRHRAHGEMREARAVIEEMRRMPSSDPHDPTFRRLRYVRYADDWLLGFVGPKAEAEAIKRDIGTFLRDTLKLELSDEKTLITHAASQAARFLGYDIAVQHADDRLDRNGRRTVNGIIGLRVPAAVIAAHCAPYMRNGKVVHRPERTEDSAFTIVSRYQAEYRGVVQYYLLAQNVAWFNTLHWVMQTSLLKTLASKHKSTVRKMARAYRSTVQTASGPLICLEVIVEREGGKKPLVARFGGIPLQHQDTATLVDLRPASYVSRRNELIKRLLADTCELCGATADCEVHHIRKLADMKKHGRKEKPQWVQVMSARRRKTLVVCAVCHDAIHAGRPTRQRASERTTGEPCNAKVFRTVRRGADGKGS